MWPSSALSWWVLHSGVWIVLKTGLITMCPCVSVESFLLTCENTDDFIAERLLPARLGKSLSANYLVWRESLISTSYPPVNTDHFVILVLVSSRKV